MSHCCKLLIICTDQPGLCHPLGIHCMCSVWQIWDFLWHETMHTACCDGAGRLGFTKTTSLERKQYHYLLGISRADRRRIQIIQVQQVHCLARAPGRIAKTALAFKWQRLTDDSKLEVTQKHGIWICLRNVTVTFESVKWKWQLLTWISLNWNRLCISCWKCSGCYLLLCYYILISLW